VVRKQSTQQVREDFDRLTLLFEVERWDHNVHYPPSMSALYSSSRWKKRTSC